jgi:hydrogenase-4 component F
VTSLALILPLLPLLGALIVLAAPEAEAIPILIAVAVVTTAVALVVAASALASLGDSDTAGPLLLDLPGGVMAGVAALVGLAAAIASPGYVRGRPRHRAYAVKLLAFWAVLEALPLAGNLGVAWVLVEASTAVSALLVSFGGTTRALEAAWKYLVLTTIGLALALLGIVIVAAGLGESVGLDALDWSSLAASTRLLDHDAALVAYVLIVGGLAAKVGWAPVHNWLPDAHSEAPAPASALLSAVLLPEVLLIAWRTEVAFAPAIGDHAARAPFLIFGLASLAIAAPFLIRPMAWKRLLAYSSLEHMGVIAVGIGVGHRLALLGAALHVVAHAIVKCVAFLAAIPLLIAQPDADRHPPGGIARTGPRLGALLALCLVALAGLPPSPLFASELLIAWGAVEAGEPWVAAALLVGLALAFVGLARVAVDTVAARTQPHRAEAPPSLLAIGSVAGVAAALAVGLLVAAAFLPGSQVADALMGALA